MDQTLDPKNRVPPNKTDGPTKSSSNPSIPKPLSYGLTSLPFSSLRPQTMSREAEAIGIGGQRWMWWAAASSAQLMAGVAWCRRGYTGTGGSMPLKAFAAASLFVSAAGSAATASFFASGFQSVEDVKEAGERFRRWMGAIPRDTTR